MDSKSEVNMAKINPTLFNSIYEMKCPRCREGELFDTTIFSFDKSFEMRERCSECSMNFSPEPGFYYGAMYVSYAIWGGISLVLCSILILVFDWNLNQSFALLFFVSIIFFVWLFRISRTLWIHANIKYRPNYIKELTQKNNQKLEN